MEYVYCGLLVGFIGLVGAVFYLAGRVLLLRRELARCKQALADSQEIPY